MRTLLLSFLAILLSVGSLFAGPVDQATAQKVGLGFAQTAIMQTAKAETLQLVRATDQYYVFNVGASGFVLVSADDRFRPIVGYSDEGSFPVENPSPEMLYYLENLSQGRQAALRTSFEADTQVTEEWTSLLDGEPLPLRNGLRSKFYLVQTKWNQSAPYNQECPGNSYAGCVATAMSQVMNFWQHPTRGRGNHTYHHRVWGDLSADFSSEEYRFDLMPNSIGLGSPQENIDAIATFMYHCGIAVDMDYSTDGSGAYSQDVPEAVLKYFDYTNRCRLYSRDAFELAEFQGILKDQFDLGWPCYYSGTDPDEGGHAFVCDGYDENDLFHFNWGWGGSGDGFFAIDELNVSSYAFNSGQAVIANFVPSDLFLNTANAPDYFTAVPNVDEEFSVTLSWVNPATSMDGRPLESIDRIVLLRDGKEMATFEHPEPGASMTQVLPTYLPATVDFMVYAECNGIPGRKARVEGVCLGPVCDWKVRCYSADEIEGSRGMLVFYNSAGVKLAEFVPEQTERSLAIGVPQGRVSMAWTAPSDSIYLEISILDSEDQPVFTYTGPSVNLPTGFFYETVNTCGGSGILTHPSELTAEVDEENVCLRWKGIPDPGYGYNIYRDGYLYSMVANTTSFVDEGSASDMHSYFVTAFHPEGESDPSNTCCAVKETEATCPRNLDGEVLTGRRIKLTWELPEDTVGLTAFVIYRRIQGEPYKIAKTVSGNKTNYTLQNQSLGKRYYFKITALYGEQGEVESSPARSAVHPELYYLEINGTHLPSGLQLDDQGEGKLLLHWDPALNAKSYNLYRNGELYRENLTETHYTDTLTDLEGILVYQVTGVLKGVESSPSNRACWGNVSVPETETASLKLFPNPTSGMVSLQAEGLQEVSVFNVNGQLLQCCQVEGDELVLDFSEYRSGLLYLRVQTDQGILVRKVVVMP